MVQSSVACHVKSNKLTELCDYAGRHNKLYLMLMRTLDRVYEEEQVGWLIVVCLVLGIHAVHHQHVVHI